jgi:hypothetical protein
MLMPDKATLPTRVGGQVSTLCKHAMLAGNTPAALAGNLAALLRGHRREATPALFSVNG